MNRQNKSNPAKTDKPTANSPIPLKENLKERMLDHYDLQQIFNVTRGTIYNWCRKGMLKVIRIDGKNYFDANDIEELIQKLKQITVPAESRRKK
jgi:hypothetical protein